MNPMIRCRTHRMDLVIKGIRTKRERVIIEDAVNFYLYKMLPSNIVRTLYIELSFRKKLDDDADGYCQVSGYNSRNRAREFEIEIQNNPSFRYKLMTLAHECVHLKQYALDEIDEGMNTWKGVRVPTSTDYWDSPWEIEAHGREKGLYTRFCETYGLKFPHSEKERDN